MIVILGPTAAGKTSLGITAAQKTHGSVVSADSRQLYAGMDVGTSSPAGLGQESHHLLQPDVIDGVEHYGFNIREPDRQITLGQWQRAAFKMIDHVISQGRVPLLVGGTMLYIDSVVDNYEIPAVPPDRGLRDELKWIETARLYARLIAQDPGATKFVEPGNKRRIIRALEVMEATGRPFSQQRRKRQARYETQIFGLFPGWAVLNRRISARASQMMNNGLLEETRRLQDRYGKDLPLLQTMNYRQAAYVLSGIMAKEQAVGEMTKVNARYARRQMSWWRRRQDIQWFAQPSNALRLFHER